MVDALSRKKHEEECSLSLITSAIIDWIYELKVAYDENEVLKNLIDQCKEG